EHLDLAVTIGAGADADGRDLQAVGDRARQARGHALEHDREGAGLLEGLGVVEEPDRRLRRLALDLEAAELVDRLRREAESAHDRDAGTDQALPRRRGADAAFELHRLAAGLL